MGYLNFFEDLPKGELDEREWNLSQERKEAIRFHFPNSFLLQRIETSLMIVELYPLYKTQHIDNNIGE